MSPQKSKKTAKETEDQNKDIDTGTNVVGNPTKTGGANLKDLIEKNIKWSQVLYEQNKAIKRRLTAMAVLSWLKVIIILIPIVLGIIFLPGIIKDAWSQYSETGNLGDIINQLSPEQIQETLKLLQGR